MQGCKCTAPAVLLLYNLHNNANKSNSDFYDAYIILIIDSLKKNNFKKADEYLTQSLIKLLLKFISTNAIR